MAYGSKRGMVDLFKYLLKFFERKIKLYEIDGAYHSFSFGFHGLYPKSRFITKYKKRWYILGPGPDGWIWRRPSSYSIYVCDEYKKPTSALIMLVMTGLDWEVEKKKVKKFKYYDLPFEMGGSDIIYVVNGERYE